MSPSAFAEVIKMKQEQISKIVDGRIQEEELPVRANLKVVRRHHPDYGLTEEEIMDRNEFIRCCLRQDFEPLLRIPKQDTGNDFFTEDFQESAFNTHDFQKSLRPFKKYGYAMRKIMERVEELAIMHSCISSPEGRMNTLRRYEALVESEFRERLLVLVERFKRTTYDQRRFELKRKIAQLNLRIMECKRIWERYSPPDAWDH